MGPRQLENGDLLVPVRLTHDGVVGDGVEIIRPDHPDYADWLAEVVDNPAYVSEPQEGISEPTESDAGLPGRP